MRKCDSRAYVNLASGTAQNHALYDSHYSFRGPTRTTISIDTFTTDNIVVGRINGVRSWMSHEWRKCENLRSRYHRGILWRDELLCFTSSCLFLSYNHILRRCSSLRVCLDSNEMDNRPETKSGSQEKPPLTGIPWFVPFFWLKSLIAYGIIFFYFLVTGQTMWLQTSQRCLGVHCNWTRTDTISNSSVRFYIYMSDFLSTQNIPLNIWTLWKRWDASFLFNVDKCIC